MRSASNGSPVRARRCCATDGPDAAREVLIEALALWRGTALAEFRDQPVIASEAARLTEVRAETLEARIAADLALGAARVGHRRAAAARRRGAAARAAVGAPDARAVPERAAERRARRLPAVPPPARRGGRHRAAPVPAPARGGDPARRRRRWTGSRRAAPPPLPSPTGTRPGACRSSRSRPACGSPWVARPRPTCGSSGTSGSPGCTRCWSATASAGRSRDESSNGSYLNGERLAGPPGARARRRAALRSHGGDVPAAPRSGRGTDVPRH